MGMALSAHPPLLRGGEKKWAVWRLLVGGGGGGGSFPQVVRDGVGENPNGPGIAPRPVCQFSRRLPLVAVGNRDQRGDALDRDVAVELFGLLRSSP